jgi:hypothetical protein
MSRRSFQKKGLKFFAVRVPVLCVAFTEITHTRKHTHKILSIYRNTYLHVLCLLQLLLHMDLRVRGIKKVSLNLSGWRVSAAAAAAASTWPAQRANAQANTRFLLLRVCHMVAVLKVPKTDRRHLPPKYGAIALVCH